MAKSVSLLERLLFDLIAGAHRRGAEQERLGEISGPEDGYRWSEHHARETLKVQKETGEITPAAVLCETEGPRIVCLSGSSRFIDRMAVEAWQLEKEGAIALACHLLPRWYTTATDHVAEQEGVAEEMDELHLRKIDMAHELLVINVDGYIGDSTRAEIAYARRLGKPVRYLQPGLVGGDD